jgi:hypothetical protein
LFVTFGKIFDVLKIGDFKNSIKRFFFLINQLVSDLLISARLHRLFSGKRRKLSHDRRQIPHIIEDQIQTIADLLCIRMDQDGSSFSITRPFCSQK